MDALPCWVCIGIRGRSEAYVVRIMNVAGKVVVCGWLSVGCVPFGVMDVFSALDQLGLPNRANGRMSIVSGGVSPGSWGYALSA